MSGSKKSRDDTSPPVSMKKLIAWTTLSAFVSFTGFLGGLCTRQRAPSSGHRVRPIYRESWNATHRLHFLWFVFPPRHLFNPKRAQGDQ